MSRLMLRRIPTVTSNTHQTQPPTWGQTKKLPQMAEENLKKAGQPVTMSNLMVAMIAVITTAHHWVRVSPTELVSALLFALKAGTADLPGIRKRPPEKETQGYGLSEPQEGHLSFAPRMLGSATSMATGPGFLSRPSNHIHRKQALFLFVTAGQL
nr:uncharacterized protein LOC129523830 [Gorilla gorilla gorilla]